MSRMSDQQRLFEAELPDLLAGGFAGSWVAYLDGVRFVGATESEAYAWAVAEFGVGADFVIDHIVPHGPIELRRWPAKSLSADAELAATQAKLAEAERELAILRVMTRDAAAWERRANDYATSVAAAVSSHLAAKDLAERCVRRLRQGHSAECNEAFRDPRGPWCSCGSADGGGLRVVVGLLDDLESARELAAEAWRWVEFARERIEVDQNVVTWGTCCPVNADRLDELIAERGAGMLEVARKLRPDHTDECTKRFAWGDGEWCSCGRAEPGTLAAVVRLGQERDALQTKVEAIRAWASGRSARAFSTCDIHDEMADLMSLLDGEPQ